MKLSHLRYIDQIRQCGSLNAAARELSISQQALSKALSAFEQEIGLKLFRRERDGMSPTEEGLVVLNGAEQILEDVDLLLQSIERLKSPRENIRVGIPEGFLGGADTPIPMDYLLEFLDASEAVNYLIVELPNNQIGRHMHMGLLDASLVLGFPPARCRGPLVFKDSLKAVVPKESPYVDLGTVRWSDLRNKEFVMAPDSEYVKKQVSKRCEKAGFTPTFLPSVSQFDGNLSLVRNNRAIFLCHSDVRLSETNSDRHIVLEFVPEDTVEFCIYFVWHEHSKPSEGCLLLKNFIMETMTLKDEFKRRN